MLTVCIQYSQQLSQIEKSVTRLLVATKQLLETLTEWSRSRASESEVSDVYVSLGYEFNIACRAFSSIGVETSDLGNVPDLLRSILEDTLSQEASPESLDRYLPRIRDILVNLLQGLKKKQQRLRQRQPKDDYPAQPDLARASTSDGADSFPTVQSLSEPSNQNDFSQNHPVGESRGSYGSENPGIPPPRSSSIPGGRSSPSKSDESSANSQRTSSRRSPEPPESSYSDNSNHSIPSVPSIAQHESNHYLGNLTSELPIINTPPIPKQDDALAALQRGGQLERRASRRYSSFQIAKAIGTSPGGMPLPAAQNTPAPNRGRDVRESMNAVRTRGSAVFERVPIATSKPQARKFEEADRSDRGIEQTSDALVSAPEQNPITNHHQWDSDNSRPAFPAGDGVIDPDSPIIKRGYTGTAGNLVISQTGGRPLDKPAENPSNQNGIIVSTPIDLAETSLVPDHDLTLFLQYKTKIKKFVFTDGAANLSMARLQLAFIEKFAWNTHENGNDLPEIYIQDPVSGVRHELEDLSDVRDRSVLVLNTEVLDEVKRHIDEGFGNLRALVSDVKTRLEGQAVTIQRVSDRQQEAAKEIAQFATAPVRTNIGSNTANTDKSAFATPKNAMQQLNEVQNLRRDLAVMRQTYTEFVTDIKSSMTTIKEKASAVKSVAVSTAAPDLSDGTGRAYVADGKKRLGDESDDLVAKVDDLQDVVEDLRKDVLTRGVRPLPRQLEILAKDISVASTRVKKMQEFLKREKPVWTKIWEEQLELVCEEREFLSMQIGLSYDLENDLKQSTDTFALVEACCKQQMKENAPRVPSRTLTGGPDLSVSPHAVKESVLGEVRALRPNHENRLEAIERAEKARQKELESRRGDVFTQEVASFVGSGKLKKSGGVEEIERLRKAKDDKIRREVWERQNGISNSEEQPVAEQPPEEGSFVNNPEQI
jgi:hypothetical protein